MPTEVQRLAGLARAAIDNDTSRPSRSNEEHRAKPRYAATMRLRAALIAELDDEELADRILSRWLITRRPIDVCIAEGKEEPRGGWPETPSPSGRLGSPTGEKRLPRPR